MSEKEKKKENTSKTSIKAVVLTPYEEAEKVAKDKLPKLYKAMEVGSTIYTGPEVAEAIGLDPNSDVDVQAVGLAWHALYDAGVVSSPQMTKPAKPAKKGKPVLPVM